MNPVNEIVITPTARGYATEFPYKPGRFAIAGFHSLGMVWRKDESGVKWLIPAGKIDQAVDFIDYWFGKNREPGREAYGVRIPEVLQEAA